MFMSSLRGLRNFILVAALPACISSVDQNTSSRSPQLLQSFELGSPLSAQDIRSLQISVAPDGEGLPKGSGRYEEGKVLYQSYCMACHGASLEGNPQLAAPRLIGGRHSLKSPNPVKTVESYWPYATTLFDYIQRAMPFGSPGILTSDEIYAVSAYILGEANILNKNVTLNKQSMLNIEMPNRHGFIR